MTEKQLEELQRTCVWGWLYDDGANLIKELRKARAESKRMGDAWEESRKQNWQLRLENEELHKRLGDRSEVNTTKLNDAFTEGTLAAGDAMREQVEKAFSRGVAAMREAAAKECWMASDELADVPDMESEQGTLQNVAYRIRALPDPEDNP